MNAAVGVPDRVGVGQRHRRLEDRDGVVGERPDGAAGEARHALGRLDAAARHERPQRRRADRGASHRRIGSSGS